MQAGQETKMMRGAVWACALPIFLGVFGLLFFILAPTADVRGFRFMGLPIAACFIFGTPISAWLACRRLRKTDSFIVQRKWSRSASSGLLAATIVHFLAAFLYTLGFLVVDSVNSLGVGGFYADLFFISGLINLGLWGVLTVPFSLLCATIFWFVTNFQQDTSAF